MSTANLKTVATGKKENPVASFSNFLEKFKPQMALALPKHLTADRMARLAVTAFSTTPKLQECEPKSILGAIMTASTLGLEINVDGQGFLVPYGRTCTFVPGWKGLVDLVSRSGRATVWTGAVFEGDDFDYALGDSPFIRHKPGEENDPDKLTHVYAVGRVNGSQLPVIEVWTIKKIWKHRDKYNKQGGKHYSFRDPEMYARKIPLLQVLKYMPKSIELSNAVALSAAVDEGKHAVIEGDFVTVTDPDTGEIRGMTDTEQRSNSGGTPGTPYSVMLDRIQKCNDIDVLDICADEVRDYPENERVKLEQAYMDRREVLTGA
ncbi:recombinase RecT [Cupriavidus basilensis]|uniref:recombinase RecT n=1 Tax=Cupriavidus basilensis TaxID=68895 RepID=UPI0009E2E981|nr:recombinase RecT [Cupriavidus basilensis]